AWPGLFDFLEDCRKLFPRIVIFTSVNEERFRSIANLLTTEGYAPNWFANIEYITWNGETKNLIFVDGASPEEILLVDDYEKYVHPGQENQWIKVPYFDYPYSDDDLGLGEVFRLLRIRVGSGRNDRLFNILLIFRFDMNSYVWLSGYSSSRPMARLGVRLPSLTRTYETCHSPSCQN